MNLEKIPLNKLVFDPNNARVHGWENIRVIRDSLKAFGQQKPIVVDDDNLVIAGNGTLQAAIELGWNEIDIVRTKLKGAEAKAFALADNRTSELAEWDHDILRTQLSELKSVDFDIEEIGFSLTDVVGHTRNGEDVETKAEIFNVVTIFDNEDDQQELFLELRDRGFKVKV